MPDLAEDSMLLLHVRSSRRKAMAAAVCEVRAVFRDLPIFLRKGGPLGEMPGIIWVQVPADRSLEAAERCRQLGYVNAADLVHFCSEKLSRKSRSCAAHLWRGRPFTLERVYEEDPRALHERAPDRRVFLLPTADGSLRHVRGYRGSSGDLNRRGLPACDARLLVNLARASPPAWFLDPFAGVGGLVLEAHSLGLTVVSLDIDPRVRFGLSEMGAIHVVGDARSLPFGNDTFSGIATEVPFSETALQIVLEALQETARVLAAGGRMAVMVAEPQREPVEHQARTLDLACETCLPVNRKGLGVYIFVWRKGTQVSELQRAALPPRCVVA